MNVRIILTRVRASELGDPCPCRKIVSQYCRCVNEPTCGPRQRRRYEVASTELVYLVLALFFLGQKKADRTCGMKYCVHTKGQSTKYRIEVAYIADRVLDPSNFFQFREI